MQRGSAAAGRFGRAVAVALWLPAPPMAARSTAATAAWTLAPADTCHVGAAAATVEPVAA